MVTPFTIKRPEREESREETPTVSQDIDIATSPAVSGMSRSRSYKSARPEREVCRRKLAVVSQDRVAEYGESLVVQFAVAGAVCS
jgi:hypothetical protein